jgi:hypothetical protein
MAQKSEHNWFNRRILLTETECFDPLHSISLHLSDISLDLSLIQREKWGLLSIGWKRRQEGYPNQTAWGVSIWETQYMVFTSLILSMQSMHRGAWQKMRLGV